MTVTAWASFIEERAYNMIQTERRGDGEKSHA
jgi:hypothetical protein